MIVRNEEAVLERCLDSVAELVDEIILVDTGSTDDTKKIASKFSAKIYDFPWRDDFSAARNYAVAQAVGDYWFWLDADDVVEGENREKLRRILAHPDADVVFLPYQLSFDEDGKPQMISCRERIFRRSVKFQWEGAVHEAIVPRGKVRYGDAAISHRKIGAGSPDRNLHIYQQKLMRGENFSPQRTVLLRQRTVRPPCLSGSTSGTGTVFAGWKGLGTGLHGSVSALRKLLPKTETAGAGAEKPAACAGIRCADAGALL
ncbi:glycosyltransferase family 2 protein [Ruminococcus sp.]|uniref:glycosyltransferase family 2 protein n=1 Tax=Ruminococcus sp. TaxID=41978 RepID=UPI00300F7169